MIPRVRAERPPGERGQSLVEFALLAPLMIFLLFAILDLSRIYTAMASVESAAREAADYATSAKGAPAWATQADIDETVAEMKKRACFGASNLPDYVGVDTSPADGVDEDCTNPTFSYCVRETTGSACAVPSDPTNPAYTCGDENRDPPCRVTVTLHHIFHLFVPFQLDFFGVQLGLPVTLEFDRDSTFAMTDIDVTTSPAP